MTGLLLRGGHVLTGDGRPPLRADVLVEGDRVTAILTDGADGGSDGADGGSGGPDRTADSDATVAVGAGDVPPGVEVIDASGRLVLPGFVDAHSHAEGVVFDERVQLALLRQGVTTVIGGQDGVSYAPGDGAFASRYFAPINGAHPSYAGPRVANLLASYDGRIPLGVAYLVPAGTVRHEVMGGVQRPATAEEIASMTTLVGQGIEDGAVGLSTGLDYAPGIFADAAEIAALCAPLAPAGLPYVTHMRGGYELNAQVGVEEAAVIGRSAGVPVHLSHFHTPAAEAARLMAWLEGQGVSGSFDAYPYTRGCSLLAMTMLPPAWNALDPAVAIEQLADPVRREELRRDWFPQVARNPSLGPEWAELITLAHTAAPQLDWAPGLTLAQIAERRGTDPVDAALDVLLLSRLDANVVMAVQDQRPVADLGALIAHPAHMGGSDGIFIGAHPHPRARGTFAAYLATYVIEHGHLDWPSAVQHLATAPADRFHLGDRGRICPGSIADLILVDPHRVREAASYDSPLELAEGIDDVVVGGRPVLRGGRLTGETPGGGVRAAAAP